jgi:hypothetical protein
VIPRDAARRLSRRSDGDGAARVNIRILVLRGAGKGRTTSKHSPGTEPRPTRAIASRKSTSVTSTSTEKASRNLMKRLRSGSDVVEVYNLQREDLAQYRRERQRRFIADIQLAHLRGEIAKRNALAAAAATGGEECSAACLAALRVWLREQETDISTLRNQIGARCGFDWRTRGLCSEAERITGDHAPGDRRCPQRDRSCGTEHPERVCRREPTKVIGVAKCSAVAAWPRQRAAPPHRSPSP